MSDLAKPSYSSIVLSGLFLLWWSIDISQAAVTLDGPAQSHILYKSVEFLEDDNRSLSWHEVLDSSIERQWLTTKKVNAGRSYYDGTLWAKITLNNNQSISDWMLMVNWAHLQYLDMRVVDEQGDVIESFETGLSRPFNQRPVENRFYTFPIKFYLGDTITLYFKVQNEFNIQLPLKIYSLDEYNKMEQYKLLWLGSFFGILLVMAVYNLFIYLSTAQTSYLYYVIFVLCNFLYQASFTGIGHQYLWRDNDFVIANSYSFFTSLVYIPASLFMTDFLNLKKEAPRLFIIARILTGAWICMAIFAFVAPSEIVRHYNGPLVLVSSAYALGLGFYFWAKGQEIAKYYTIAWFILIASTVILVLMSMGFVPKNLFTENIQQAGTIIEVVLLSLALGVRIKQYRQDKQKAEADANLSDLKSKAKSEFLATMSHEIRTPMNGVLGMAALLKESELDKNQSELLGYIESSGEALLTIINDILDYSKIEAGKLEVENIPYSLRQTVEQSCAVFKVLAKNKNIPLSISVDEKIPNDLMGDANRIRQMLLNFISNAYKFTNEGTIRVNVKFDDSINNKKSDENESLIESFIVFEVIDPGIGISKENCEKLFSAFTQAESSTSRKFGGTGLGLAITKQLAGLMGGRVGVTSELGEGSTFWFSLPMIEAEKSVAASNKESLSGIALKDHKLKVLVAEDNQVNQLVIKGMLAKLSVEADFAVNGVEAVEKFRQHRTDYNAILMDCEMPELDGFEATRFLRAYEKSKALSPMPILALTAHAMEETHKNCLQSGMDDIIVKPINQNQLANQLAQAVGISATG